MKEYPSIPRINDDLIGRSCISFYKYDGSNIRSEYSKKKGWYKWGTRRRLFDKTDRDYGCAIEIFQKEYAESLEKIIRDVYKAEKAIAFLEFFGPHSFAGKHEPGELLGADSNDPKQLVLFDINIHRKGIVGPKEFIKNFGNLKIPDVIYEGFITEEFLENVRHSRYPINEGVVCKGGEGHKLWMTKVKSWDYLRRLKEKFGECWKEHWE